MLTIQYIEDRLKSAGIQPTAQRIAICQYLLEEPKHITVEDVKKWAEDNFPKVSLATVYNTLNSLVDAGILKSLKLPHSEKVIYDSNTEPHFHFLDQKTGILSDISVDNVEFSHNLENEFNVKGIDVLFYGTRK